MSLQVQSGSTSVNGTVTASGTFTATTRVLTFARKVANNNTQTWTVPVGKKWTVIKIAFSNFTGATPGSNSFSIKGAICLASTSGANQPAIQVIDSTYEAPIATLVAGDTMTAVTANASHYLDVTVWYVEETA